MMLYHLLCVLEDVFFVGYLLIMNVIWNMNIFSECDHGTMNIFLRSVSVHDSDVSG